MTSAYVVGSGATSVNLVAFPGDSVDVKSGGELLQSLIQFASVTVSGGGESADDVFTDRTFVQIMSGGQSVADYFEGAANALVDGELSAATVQNGAFVHIDSDGQATNLSIFDGGDVLVTGDGVAPGTGGIVTTATMSSGGHMEVTFFGTVSQVDMLGGELDLLQGNATQTRIFAGGIEVVASADSHDTDAEVTSSGTLDATSSATAEGAQVLLGGLVIAETGGVVSGATISSGGASVERFGGIASGATLLVGAVDTVSSTGVAVSAIVSGQQLVMSGGAATATTLLGGGEQIVSGGAAWETQVETGGQEVVVASGEALQGTVLAGGVAIAEGGGLIEAFVISSGGNLEERSAGVADDLTVLAGAAESVSSNGASLQTVVFGAENVSGGQTDFTTVSSGGKQTVFAGGLADATSAVVGGTEVVSSGGVASDSTVAGGALVVSGGGVAVNTHLQFGVETIDAGGVASGVNVFQGRTVVSSAGALIGATIQSAATLVLRAGAIVGGIVSAGGVGKLELANGAGTLSGAVGIGALTVSAAGAADAVTDFGQLTIDAAASYTAAAGFTVSGGLPSGLLLVHGRLIASSTLTVGGGLVLGGSTGSRALTGTGTLALVGGELLLDPGAVLGIAHVTASGGLLEADANVTYGGVCTQSGGSITFVGGGKTLTFTGAGDIFSGTVFEGPGRVAFASGSDLISGATLSAASIGSSAAVTLGGTIKLVSALTATTSNLTIDAGGATLTGGGTLALSNVGTNRISGATPSATLTVSNATISGAGQLGGGSMSLTNLAAGKIIANRGLALVINTGANVVGNGGLIASEGAGGLTIKGAIANAGTLLVTSGALTVSGAVTGGGGVTISGGVAHFVGAFAENVDFTGASGVLELGKSQGYTGFISGFTTQGLDLRDIAFAAGTTHATYVDNGFKTAGVLTVTDGTHSAHINLVGDFTSSTFTVASDLSGGTVVSDPIAPHAEASQVDGSARFVASLAGFAGNTRAAMPPEPGGRALSPPPAAILAATLSGG